MKMPWTKLHDYMMASRSRAIMYYKLHFAAFLIIIAIAVFLGIFSMVIDDYSPLSNRNHGLLDYIIGVAIFMALSAVIWVGMLLEMLRIRTVLKIKKWI